MGRGGGGGRAGGTRKGRAGGGGGSVSSNQVEVTATTPPTQIASEDMPTMGVMMEKYDPRDVRDRYHDYQLTDYTPEGWEQLPEGGLGQKEFGKWDYENLHAYSGGSVPGGEERFGGLRSEYLNAALHSSEERFNTMYRKYLETTFKEPMTDAELSVLRDRYKAWGRDLEDSLSKIKPTPGTSYRTLSSPVELGGGKDTVVTDMFQEGQVYKPNAFMSTARKSDIDFRGYDSAVGGEHYIDPGNGGKIEVIQVPMIRVKVEGKTGKNISPASRFYAEHETLFQRDAAFMVKSKTWDPKKRLWSVEMSEL